MGFIRRAQALTPFHFPLQALDGKKCQEQKNNATFSPAELPDGFCWMLGLLIRIHQNPSESIRIHQNPSGNPTVLGDNLQDPQQFTKAKPWTKSWSADFFQGSKLLPRTCRVIQENLREVSFVIGKRWENGDFFRHWHGIFMGIFMGM